MHTPSPNEFAGSVTAQQSPQFQPKSGGGRIVIIVLGLLAVIGGGIALVMFAMGEGTGKPGMSAQNVARTKRDLYETPWEKAVVKWRELASGTEPDLQQEAFAQLAWAKDKDGLQLVIAGLGSADAHVRGRAAQALAEYGTPMADAAKPVLLDALAKADNLTKPQILWALTVLHEPAAFDAVFAAYKAGQLTNIQKLDRSPAFDPAEIARMVPLDKIAPMAGDPNEGVRAFVAASLAESNDSKWVDVLTKLVQDKDEIVSREAAVGLGRLGSEQATAALLAAIERVSDESRQKYLVALRDGAGATGLVAAIKSCKSDKPLIEKFRLKQIFDMLKELEDPRGADMLAAYVKTKPAPHWSWEAGMRLAEVGDIRGAEALGPRMAQDPMKLYANEPEYRKDDDERVFGARMLADLAFLHPESVAQLRKAAEDGVMAWIVEKPAPHANGLRFLAAVKSPAALAKLKSWAEYSTLPSAMDANDKGMSLEIATARSALRYLGLTKDPSALPILEKQFTRRPKDKTVSMEALEQNGGTLLGLSVKALAEGAADGFAEYGDPKEFKLMVEHIQSDKENHQSREQACRDLPWVASDEQMKEVVKMVHDNNKNDEKSSFLRGCYLNALVARPVREATAGLVDLLNPAAVADPGVRHQVARAIGEGGVTRNMSDSLLEKVKDPNYRTDVMLAILLGADPDTAMRAMVIAYGDNPELDADLRDIYNATFQFLSDRNYESGDVARWVENAQAVGHVKLQEKFVDWPSQILARNLAESFEANTGPRSITRVQLRYRLMQDAKGTNEVKRHNAIGVLKFMKEKGVLMALRDEKPPVGDLARAAYFELMHPKPPTEQLPEAPKAKK